MSRQRQKILVVDNDPRNLFALQTVLEPLGEEVVTAASGEEALQILLRQQFAVILLDVHMPTMDGFETARLIRQRDKLRNTPIIFISAVSKDDAQVAAGYALGAEEYVLKPFVPEILRAKVAALVQRARGRSEGSVA